MPSIEILNDAIQQKNKSTIIFTKKKQTNPHTLTSTLKKLYDFNVLGLVTALKDILLVFC